MMRVSLNDKCEKTAGTILLPGTQAQVRSMLMLQGQDLRGDLQRVTSEQNQGYGG